jgi:hypothetical protein
MSDEPRDPKLVEFIAKLIGRHSGLIDVEPKRWDFSRHRVQLHDYDYFSWVSVLPPPDAIVDLREAHHAFVSDSQTLARMSADGVAHLPTITHILISKTVRDWMVFWSINDPRAERREQLREWLAEDEESQARIRRLATAELRRRGYDPDAPELVPA